MKKNIRIAQQKKLLVLLRGIRVDAGVTQAELAARLNRDQTFVSKYESGERRLDVLELREVCHATGTDFVDLMRTLDRVLKAANHEKSKHELKQEWNKRAQRPGELAVMSSQFPEELCPEESNNYANAVMAFMEPDLKGKNVLEIGSGTGRLTERILTEASRVTCIDPSTEMIKRNREQLGAKANQVTYLNIFADEYIPDQTHDIAVCSLVLNHIPDSLFPKVVEVLSMSASTLFLFEHTGNDSQISDYTFVRSEHDLIKAFERYRVERRHKYQQFFNEISLLKLIR